MQPELLLIIEILGAVGLAATAVAWLRHSEE
jgi:hypothetical protein